LKSDDNGVPSPARKQVTLNHAYQRNDDDKDREDSLTAIAVIVEEMSGKKTVQIRPKWSSPPSFEGSSVVYVLQVGQSFYVGETDALSQRIRQHRSKGSDWANSATIAVKVGKSNARNLALDNMMEGTIFKTHSKHALSMRDKNINYILRYKCI
jgi:predicted GIY-YIG superfamily endonuclease